MIIDIQTLILFFISLLANTLSALAGGGAGLLQLPALIFLGLPFSIALATHKIATVFLGLGSTVRYWRENILDIQFALAFLAFGLPGVIIGAATILSIPEKVAISSLGILTIGLGIYSFFKPELGQNYQPKNRHIKGMIVGGIVIFFIGFLNGSLTSGTGLFATLWFIYWFGMDYKRAIAYTLILVGLFWNGTGALTLGLMSTIQWNWLIPLIVGSFVGGYLGSHFATKGGNQWIKRVFELTTIATGVSLLIKGYL